MLCASIDQAITLAQKGEWDVLSVLEPQLSSLFDAATSSNYVQAVVASGQSTSIASHFMELALEKMAQLGRLLTPQRQELGELIANEANAQKLRRTYGG